MRISVVHDWVVDYQQEYDWRDGLAAAVKELGTRHEVQFLVCGDSDMVIPHPYFPIHVSTDIKRDVAKFNPDAVLMWADCTRPNAAPVSELGKPMALCFAGGDTNGPTSQYFDHFFVESAVYFDKFAVMGKSVSRAFGTNTDLFRPIEKQRKVFDAIFPATFATWKRHNLFSQATKGLLACAVGYMIPGERENYCYQWCQDAGNVTLPHVSAEAIRHLLASSKSCVITSQSTGGSQRTVLEAMAMNVPVIVCEDSDKTTEYVREGGGIVVAPNPEAIRVGIAEAADKANWNTRDYIEKNWSHVKYAADMEKELIRLCQ